MAWAKLVEETLCCDCGESLEAGYEAYVVSAQEVCCEGCYEDRLDDDSFFEDDYLIDGVGFADPGGRSALRAETDDNPRDQDCPSCGAENVLTRLDRQQGYQCNQCADEAERGY